MIEILLISLTTFAYIKLSEYPTACGRKKVFDTSLLLVVPGLIGLLWFEVLSLTYSGRIKAFDVLQKINYDLTIQLCLSVIILGICIRILNIRITKTSNNNFRKLIQNSNITFLIIVAIILSVLEKADISLAINKLLGDGADIVITLLIVRFIFSRLNSSMNLISKMSSGVSFIFILIIYILLTGDKGGIVTLLVPAALLYQFTKDTKPPSQWKSLLLIILSGFILSIMNFAEGLMGPSSDLFINLTEIFETDMLTNYFYIFYSPNCNLEAATPFWEGATFLFNDSVQTNDTIYMKKCFGEQYLAGHGKGFGLISESRLVFGSWSPIYYTICAVQLILIVKFCLARLGAFGVLLYSQSAEIFYKLYRIDMTYTYINIFFNVCAIILILVAFQLALRASRTNYVA